MSSTPGRTGARSVYENNGGRRRRGWLKWLLLLLLLLLVAVVLLLLLGGSDDKKTGVSKPSSTPGSQASNGTLVAGSTSLLPLPSAGLEPQVGQTAIAQSVRVQSVVPRRGFWVGTSQQDRIYVEYGGSTGVDEANGYVPGTGDRVDLAGSVRPSPVKPRTALHLSAADAALVKRDGGFINAKQVSRAG